MLSDFDKARAGEGWETSISKSLFVELGESA